MGQEVHFPEGPIRIELDSFEYRTTPTKMVYSAPEGEESFDDCVCALALARQQWASVAPGQNLMTYYVAQNQRAKADEAKVRELDLDDLGLIAPPTAAESLDNELTALYNETLSLYAPAEIVCKACGIPVLGQERISDGAFVWHMGCAGLANRRIAA